MYKQNDEIQKLREEILRLKDERCALILSHYYQQPEIQDIADYVGDSLELSRTAAKTNKKVIVFCGVHFMAESAAILSPDKTVLIPDVTAGCPMADMVTREALIAKKKEMQDVTVVTYVNSSAEVKAESDICCTSANVVEVVENVPKERKILFVPDRNLGSYASLKADRDIELWNGYCYVHDNLTAEDVKAAKKKHPDAKFLVHPECRPEVIEMA
ncbi:quinolinate synthase NadA, partial [Peptococcaceae bacterium]|nr:quinolinate synthase NadA [Peptococcaceae bacterium]